MQEWRSSHPLEGKAENLGRASSAMNTVSRPSTTNATRMARPDSTSSERAAPEEGTTTERSCGRFVIYLLA
jgi:hypothetical protein